jgi:hypothetical protein
MWYATVQTQMQTFRSQPNCSPFVKYMLFGFEVPVLGAGRTVGLAVTSINGNCVITLLEVRSYCRRDGKVGWVEILPTQLPPTFETYRLRYLHNHR